MEAPSGWGGFSFSGTPVPGSWSIVWLQNPEHPRAEKGKMEPGKIFISMQVFPAGKMCPVTFCMGRASREMAATLYCQGWGFGCSCPCYFTDEVPGLRSIRKPWPILWDEEMTPERGSAGRAVSSALIFANGLMDQDSLCVPCHRPPASGVFLGCLIQKEFVVCFHLV